MKALTRWRRQNPQQQFRALRKVFDDNLSLFDDKKIDVGGFFCDLRRPFKTDAGLIGLRPYASLVYHQLSVFSS